MITVEDLLQAWTIWGYSYFCGAPKPTHWMPLPEKPDWSE